MKHFHIRKKTGTIEWEYAIFKRLCLLVFLLFAFGYHSFSQSKIKVQIVVIDSVENNLLSDKELRFELRDSIAALKKLNQFSTDYFNQGYLSCGFDSVQYDSLQINAFFYLGKKINTDKLNIDSVPAAIIRKAGLMRIYSKKKSLNLKHFLRLRAAIVKHFEDIGYPFVQVKVDSLSFDNQEINGRLKINKNTYFRIDSVVIKGKPKIARKYLLHYIDIKSGEPYNQSKIDNLKKTFDDLSYLQMVKPVEVEFREGKADVYLYLKNKASNLFNGIVGFASGTEENPDFQITGDLNLVLVNSFKIGEQLELYWSKYNANSQKLKFGFQFPYLFILPAGIDFQFGLEKFNTDYLNTSISGGVSYSFSAKNKLRAYFSQNNSYLINNEENVAAGFDESSRLTAGVSFLIDNTDYRLNPRSGFFVEASSGYGTRTTTLTGSGTIVEFNTQLGYYLKLGNMGTLALKNQSAGVFSDVDFYENELFKIGGINNLRGFDEQSIIASTYSVFTFEPRLLIGRNSAIYLFADLAWYESKLVNNWVTDTPYGFGLGINIDTKAGIFKLNYALGKQFDNPIKFSDSKVHFGFTARF